jgi:hypothetical protein
MRNTKHSLNHRNRSCTTSNCSIIPRNFSHRIDNILCFRKIHRQDLFVLKRSRNHKSMLNFLRRRSGNLRLRISCKQNFQILHSRKSEDLQLSCKRSQKGEEKPRMSRTVKENVNADRRSRSTRICLSRSRSTNQSGISDSQCFFRRLGSDPGFKVL